jgi:hypothetical protein
MFATVQFTFFSFFLSSSTITAATAEKLQNLRPYIHMQKEHTGIDHYQNHMSPQPSLTRTLKKC